MAIASKWSINRSIVSMVHTNRLRQNRFAFLDVQFDVFFISKPSINIDVHFRIIKSKVLCSNLSFQKICNFGFENRVYE